ncbi:hypothetical protein V4S32_07810 [Enterococcus cecorum]
MNVVDVDVIKTLLMYDDVSLYAIEKATGISRARLSQVINNDCIEKLSIENGLKLMNYHYQLRNEAIASAYTYLKAGNYDRLVTKVMDLPNVGTPIRKMDEQTLAELANPENYEKELSWWIAQNYMYPYTKYVDSLTHDEMIKLASHTNPIIRRNIAITAEKNNDLELLKLFVNDNQEAVTEILLRVEDLEDWLIENAPKELANEATKRKKLGEYLIGKNNNPLDN